MMRGGDDDDEEVSTVMTEVWVLYKLTILYDGELVVRKRIL